MNIERLMLVKDIMLREYRLVDMDGWAYLNSCGTVCCIGGTASMLNGVKQGDVDFITSSIALGMERQPNLATKLFNPPYWELEYKKRLSHLEHGTTLYVQVVAQYIDYFLEKHYPDELAAWKEANKLPVVTTVREEVMA